VTPANAIPIGPYCATITGGQFGAGAQVTVGNRPAAIISVDSSSQITIAGAGIAAWDGTYQPVTVAVGGVSSHPFSLLVGTLNAKVSWAAASRFLEQAAFGPSHSDVVHLQQVGFNQWLVEQFRWKKSPPYALDPGDYGYYAAQFFANADNAPDQLRQKLTFALTQLFVVGVGNTIPQRVFPYYNMLYDLAFTNYPAILYAVATSPGMGFYLNIAGNQKASNGSQPNQNFAREVLQLMSIGTVMLDQSGRPIISNGKTVPTYNQSTIENFARVYTGWDFQAAVNGDYSEPFSVPMVANNAYHDTDITIHPKVLLSVPGLQLPYQITTSGDAVEELGQALANIEAHPNVAPFISKFLIQHFVTSNPTPQYVNRVAQVFQSSHGAISSVMQAILLDQEARAGDKVPDSDPTFGHLKEPAVWLTGITRAINYPVPYPAFSGGYTIISAISGWLGQSIFYPPSVFNYYSPSYEIPSALGLAPGTLGPEFQTLSTSNALGRLTYVEGYNITGYDWNAAFPSANLYANLSGLPDLLVDALDATMTQGRMPAAMRTAILAQLPNSQTPFQAASLATFMVATSSYYQVSH
jgi:uncharacterized protein (DUF1800 family)